jgi:hypothetical protein
MSWKISGQPDGSLPVVGQSYRVAHSRKGTFTGTLKSVDGEWADFEITKGRAQAILPENEVETGEIVTVRDSLCHLTAVS